MTWKRTLLAVAACWPLLAAATEPVDINRADAATLAAALKGVGPARADAIVRYRDEHGPFTSIDELAAVKGIGARVIDDNRERMTVGGGR